MGEGTHLTTKFRWRAVDAVLDGMTKTAVAVAYGIDRKTITRWANRFQEGGDDALLRQIGSGRRRKLEDLTEKELLRIVLAGAAAYDFETNLWTVGRFRRVIADEFQIQVSKNTVWRRLRLDRCFGTTKVVTSSLLWIGHLRTLPKKREHGSTGSHVCMCFICQRIHQTGTRTKKYGITWSTTSWQATKQRAQASYSNLHDENCNPWRNGPISCEASSFDAASLISSVNEWDIFFRTARILLCFSRRNSVSFCWLGNWNGRSTLLKAAAWGPCFQFSSPLSLVGGPT